MKIEYDKEADAMYIEFDSGISVKNKKIDEFTVIDFDKNGNILGMELLEDSKRISNESLSKIVVRNIVVAN